MPVACKICERPVDAISSIRCRQCRRLVCRDCVAQADPEGGALCDDCVHNPDTGAARPAARTETEEESTPVDAPAEADASPTVASVLGRRLSLRDAWHAQWPIALFVLAMAGVFLAVTFWPALRARHLRSQLDSADTRAAIAARDELIERGGRAVVREMLDELMTGTGPSRLHAVEVLGSLGIVEALPALRGITADTAEGELLRVKAQEAIVQIQEF